MSDVRIEHDWDKNPPVPIEQYEHTVRTANVGYELIFTLTHALLRALERPNLELLVVGAGGGKELAELAPGNPGWRITGVDPSEQMLARARAKTDALGVTDRISLVPGTVDDLPADPRFDAATCIFVLQLLPDNASRLKVLRGIVPRLRPGAPLIVVTGAQEYPGHFDDFAGARQHYGELMGASREEMVARVQQNRARSVATSQADYLDLPQRVGFTSVRRFFSAFTIVGWVAR